MIGNAADAESLKFEYQSEMFGNILIQIDRFVEVFGQI